ncbi:MAG: FG-GAP-like repeat-containing protein [Desulfobacteraceae bacterium]|nr:FG-GAP-like repeat-containing protein [Desulfobacteraceae bacterium]
MKKQILRIVCWSIGVMVMLAGSAAVSVHAAAERVAIVPFTVNSEKDLSFLSSGISDMLSSRLAVEDRVVIIAREKTQEAAASVSGALDEAKARDLGSRLGADWVLFGSITVLGNSASIDTKMVDVTGERETLSFFDQAETLGDIIPKISVVAADINRRVFDRTMASASASTARQQPQGEPGIYAHPDKLLQDNRGFYLFDQTGEGLQGGAAAQFWKSRNFPHLINGVAVGDVDNDGKNETVMATENDVLIYKYQDQRFYEAAKIEGPSTRVIVGVDIADINGNGIAEIFVTRLNATRSGVYSLVLEFQGDHYRTVEEDSSYFFRVVESANRGPILLGQKHRYSHPFQKGFHEMAWENGSYRPARFIPTSEEVNLLGVAIGDAMNNKMESVVAYDRSDKLRIFDEAGREAWRSSEPYGGSSLYYNLRQDDRGQPENRLYLPMRILIRYPQTETGKTSVVVVQNQEVARRKLETFRIFTDARVESISWDGLGLSRNWVTRKISGAVRDFAIADFDNDGTDELVAAVIIKEGQIAFTEKKSALIAYDLLPPQPRAEQR